MKLDKNTNEISVGYSVGSTWDLEEICSEEGINKEDIVSVNVKYDTLYLTLKDGDEIEVPGQMEYFDFKHYSKLWFDDKIVDEF